MPLPRTFQLLIFLAAIFAGSAPAFALIGMEPRAASPRSSTAGIVFSDEFARGVYLFTGSGVEQISRMPGSGMFFAVSADGRYVGYKEVDSDGLQSAVVYDLERKSPLTLQSASPRVGQVSFAGNGAVAFTAGEQLVVHFNGTTKRYELGSYANNAPVSPDGRFVVFNDDADQLWIMELETTKKQRITKAGGSYALPQWSPDGSQIVYSRLSGTLYTYSLVTGNTVMIGDGASPSWIDETTLLYVQTKIEQQEVISSELISIRSDGTDRKQLTFTNDALETDPFFDRRTQSVLYADLMRGGLYTRAFSQSALSVQEQMLLSHERSVQQESRLHRSTVPATPATPTAVYFAMPYVHQVYDTPDWYNGHWACGATSSIMVIAYYNIVPVWNVWCSASKTSPAHYSPFGRYVCEKYTYREMNYALTAGDPNGTSSAGGFGFMWTGSYSPYSRTVDYYKNHGMESARFDSSASFFPTVIANVDSGYPFTLCNGLTDAGHIIVVNGYDVNNRTLIVNDPYGNKNTGTYPSLNGKGVKYDWVGYNNGFQNLRRIYWGVSVRYQMKERADSLVDDLHLNKGFSLNTAAPSSLTQWFDKRTGGYQNGHFWWTRTKIADTCFAVWTPELSRSGYYEVSAYIPYSDATKARYKVTALDSTYTVVVNQKPVKSSWLPLGTFPFAKGTGGSVRLGDGSDTVKQAIVFDAVQWTYVNALPVSAPATAAHPRTFALQQNYPNPFNPSTTIEFELPYRTAAVLSVHDVLGKEAARLAEGMLDAGVHRYRLSADQHGLSSGVYFYSLRTDASVLTKRMILIQ